VKNVLLILLLAAGAGLYFHDKQQTDALTQAQQQIATLQQQLDEAQKAPQLGSRGAQALAPKPSGGSWMYQNTGPLDRPAYKDTSH
jgi:type II secretory pathway pseudopilin PulG